MNDMDDFLEFTLIPEDEVIERTESYVVIKRYDICLEYHQRNGRVIIFDYQDHLEEAKIDLYKFKEKYILEQYAAKFNI